MSLKAPQGTEHMTVTDYADLPDAEQKTANNVEEMVTTHELNTVLQGAVNAAFDSGSTDPVAFMVPAANP